jgi:hypothetical protein
VKRRDLLPAWRAAVFTYRGSVKGVRMTDACRVLLLKMAEHMDGNGIVSVPRTKLAEELGDVAVARITERIKLARTLGFLDPVRRGRPGVTAVYQAKMPRPEVRNLYPVEVRQTGRSQVRDPYLTDQGEADARGTDYRPPSSSAGQNGSQPRSSVHTETLAATASASEAAS